METSPTPDDERKKLWLFADGSHSNDPPWKNPRGGLSRPGYLRATEPSVPGSPGGRGKGDMPKVPLNGVEIFYELHCSRCGTLRFARANGRHCGMSLLSFLPVLLLPARSSPAVASFQEGPFPPLEGSPSLLPLPAEPNLNPASRFTVNLVCKGTDMGTGFL